MAGVGVADGRPDWGVEGRHWPHRAASFFVESGDLRWHVQRMGDGPVALLLHGTGAASHSWRELAPLLSQRFTLLLPDLPGHGFTSRPPEEGLSVSGMTASLQALCGTLGVAPQLVVGHSAGAVLALELALAGHCEPEAIVALNGAFEPFQGWAGQVFPAVARGLAASALMQDWMAKGGRNRARVRKMLEGTGSRIDEEGVALYSALLGTPGHVGSVLRMMARWDVRGLAGRLAALEVPLTLVTGLSDLAVPPRVARAAHAAAPNSFLVELPGLGHLAHEEASERVAAVIAAAWDRRRSGGSQARGAVARA